jgi:hypothetical protein
MSPTTVVPPSLEDINDATHHRLECQCQGCTNVQNYEAITTGPRLKPAIELKDKR